MEIERKFLLSGVPDFSACEGMSSSHLRQAYVARHENGVVRIREDDGNSILTVKGTGTLSREEHEIAVSNEMAALLFSMKVGTTIEKIRYRVPDVRGVVHEVDVFEGELSGLVFMEIEFADENSANLYTPSLFKDLVEKEVTEDSRYSNSKLSLCGMPK